MFQLQLLFRLLDDFLDPSRMDPAVLDQAQERAARDLPPDRVEAREDDRFGSVVDEGVHKGRSAERRVRRPHRPLVRTSLRRSELDHRDVPSIEC